MSDRAKEYFINLQSAIDSEEYDDVITIATQILNFMPDDVEAKQCRIVANLMNGNFQDAWSDLQTIKGCEFEKAYCLYKLDKFNESYDIIKSLPAAVKKEERFVHLAGQVLFRLDQGKECLALYEELPKDEITEDTLVNISAACAISHSSDKAIECVAENSVIEQIYNTAIALIEDGQKEKALEFIEKGYAMEENKESLICQLFTILRALVQSPSADYDPAKILLQLAENEKSANYTRSIAACNYVGLAPDDKATHKKLRHLYSDIPTQSGVRNNEVEAALVNTFVLAHQFGESKKTQGLIGECAKLPHIDPLIQESFQRTIDPSKATNSKYTPIFDAQAKIQANQYIEAAKILMATDLAKEPRTIAVISELFVAGKDENAAIDYLKKSENETPAFLEYASRFALKHGANKEASKWADKLVKVTSNAPWAVALLATTYSSFDLEMAERYAQRLKSQGISNEEADKLETTQLVTKLSTRNEESKEVITAFDKIEVKAKPKRDLESMSEEKLKALKAKHRRRRRLQLPKNYDPNRVPDPERWTRKSQRIAAKGRKRPKAPQAKSAGLGGKAIEAPKQNPPAKPKKGKSKGKSKKW